MAGLPGYNWSRRFNAQHDHAPALLFVVIAHQAAFLHFERAKALVIGPYAPHRPRCRVVATDLGDAATKLRAHRLDHVGFVLDGVCILNREAHRASGSVTACLCAGAAAPDDGEIDADGLEAFFLVAAESLTQADQQNYGSDSPDDPEHGQKATQFMRGDGRGGLPQHFPDVQGSKSSRALDEWRALM